MKQTFTNKKVFCSFWRLGKKFSWSKMEVYRWNKLSNQFRFLILSFLFGSRSLMLLILMLTRVYFLFWVWISIGKVSYYSDNLHDKIQIWNHKMHLFLSPKHTFAVIKNLYLHSSWPASLIWRFLFAIDSLAPKFLFGAPSSSNEGLALFCNFMLAHPT